MRETFELWRKNPDRFKDLVHIAAWTVYSYNTLKISLKPVDSHADLKAFHQYFMASSSKKAHMLKLSFILRRWTMTHIWHWIKVSLRHWSKHLPGKKKKKTMSDQLWCSASCYTLSCKVRTWISCLNIMNNTQQLSMQQFKYLHVKMLKGQTNCMMLLKLKRNLYQSCMFTIITIIVDWPLISVH